MDVFALSTVIRADGGQQVLRTLEQVDRAGRATAGSLNTTTTSTRSLSGGFGILSSSLQNLAQDFAVTGKVGTREIKSLVRGGTEFALLMGVGGPIVAGIGLTLATIIGMHSRARAEMQRTTEQHIAAFEALVASTDREAMGKETSGQMRTLQEERQLLKELQEQLAETPPRIFASRLAEVKGISEANADYLRIQRQIEATKDRIAIADMKSQVLQMRQNELTYEAAATEKLIGDDKARTLAMEREREQTLKRIAELEKTRQAAVQDTFEHRMEARLRAARGEFGDLREIGIRVPITVDDRQIRDRLARLGTSPELLRAQQEAGASLGAALSGGITSTIAAAFAGGDLGETALAGLGSMIVRFGEVIITFSGFLETFKTALLTNPIFAGATGFVIGAAMIALGSALRGAAGGSGGGRGGFGGIPIGRQDNVSRFTFGQQDATSGMAQEASKLTPVQPVTINATFIGTHDLRAQRDVVEMVRLAALRGITP